MNQTAQLLDDFVRSFAARWERVGKPEIGEELLADPVLVLDHVQ